MIGTKILQLRSEKGWTQGEVGERIGVHSQTISRWERGGSLPDAEEVANLAKLFNVTADYLLFDNVPRDGRVDIPDGELMNLFEALNRLGDKPRDLVKRFLKAFVFREEILQEIEREGR